MKKILFTLFVIGCIANINAQVPSYMPTNGLVAYYPFNGNANDESGNGNNGELNFRPEFMTFGAEEVWIQGSQQGGCGSCNSLEEQHFNGKLDDIGIWNRALTEEEVANLYASNETTPITDANFQDAINNCLASNPVDGMCSDSEYGAMPDWDVSQVTDMSNAFKSNSNFNADISAWDVRNVTNMIGMFSNA